MITPMTILLLMEIFWVNLIFVGWGLLSRFLLPSLRILTPQECLFWGPGPIDDPINVFLPLKINMPPAKKGSKGDPFQKELCSKHHFSGSSWLWKFRSITLPETNSSLHLKIDGWKTIRLPFGIHPILGALAVSFRGCTKSTPLEVNQPKTSCCHPVCEFSWDLRVCHSLDLPPTQ